MKSLLIACLLVSGCCKSESSTESGGAVADQPSGAPFDVTTTAEKLFEAYEENEVRADSKFKDKRVVCVGKVDSIDKDFLGNIVLRLKAGGRFDTVSGTLLDSEKSKAGELSKDDVVMLVCIGGTRVVSVPTLQKCRILTDAELKRMTEERERKQREKFAD